METGRRTANVYWLSQEGRQRVGMAARDMLPYRECGPTLRQHVDWPAADRAEIALAFAERDVAPRRQLAEHVADLLRRHTAATREVEPLDRAGCRD